MKSNCIVFIVPSLADSHYKNRILEFIDHGFDVEVYGFERKKNELKRNLPYKYSCLGEIDNKNYLSRLPIYTKSFYHFSAKYKNRSVCFYLGGLDIAMCFLFLNKHVRYIYEECDLMHTYTRFKDLLEMVDKRIIKKSLLTVSTSEGFNRFHFSQNTPSQVCLVPNRLNPSILDYPVLEKESTNIKHLRVGFVGVPRSHTNLLIDTFCKSFPQHSFHLYGGPIPESLVELKVYKNFIDHGFFKNPDDLPKIYANLDLVLCTYDNRYTNPKYAEPNKLYDSIYFETPIIVSSGTYLSEKVRSLNIGYEIDPFDKNCIVEFFNSLTKEDLTMKIESCKKIDKQALINKNDSLFRRLDYILAQ